MKTSRWAVLVLLLLGCDDHLFPAGMSVSEGGYEPTWDGVQLLMSDAGCLGCHAALEPILPSAIEDDLAQALGALVVPGEPENSLLWRVLMYEEGLVGMPPSGPLAQDQIAAVEQWILDGAPLD